MKSSWAYVALLSSLCPAAAHAKIVSQAVTYRDGKDTLEGWVAWDDAKPGKRPGVLVVHAWMGLDGYAKKRTEMLAELGYVAFAADIYGKDARPKSTEEAAKLAGAFRGGDRARLRRRANLALAQLAADPHVEPGETAAIGYCFGGTTVLELARSGAAVRGVVSFHGGLDAPAPSDAKQIRGRVLALAGGADPYQKPEELQAFTQSLNEAGVDWQLQLYGGAVHCFTHFDDKGDRAKGCAYDARADRRSWAELQRFLGELFSAR